MSPVHQGLPLVSVPYLIRLNLGFNTVSTDCGSRGGSLVSTKEVVSCPALTFLS